MYCSNCLDESHTVIASDGTITSTLTCYYSITVLQYYYLVSISVYIHIANGWRKYRIALHAWPPVIEALYLWSRTMTICQTGSYRWTFMYWLVCDLWWAYWRRSAKFRRRDFESPREGLWKSAGRILKIRETGFENPRGIWKSARRIVS